jgi:hypothetical protein
MGLKPHNVSYFAWKGDLIAELYTRGWKARRYMSYLFKEAVERNRLPMFLSVL